MMEAQLQALKVADLKSLLQASSLPVSGNKPDLVKRLLENPQATASLNSTAQNSGANGSKADEEDLLAFDGDASKPDADAAAPAPAAGLPANASASVKAESAPTPNAEAADIPKASTTATAAACVAPAPTEAELKAAQIVELQKRLKRLQKFGGSTAEAEEMQRQIERTEKYGVSLDAHKAMGIAQLNSELGEGRGPREGRKKEGVDNQASAKPDPPKPEMEESKAARIAREQADAAAKQRRLERFGPVIGGNDTAASGEKRNLTDSGPERADSKKAKRV
ncbi:hypothetical protein K437DRAFT_273299 [Tilletiaria anomala UBC 951]|uniref:SAP domain-containing protein n=1 Tax=Tilletiaria anomala (strain ATCC 24038 / CBS 436.72 / UBC 951) TaxID=1037660 RepID=A0A066WEP2_TILAU|nr:uncharacterized protein K437DRAFT_273299 [Tilletiaria anomala UBC 951]KDN49225.1 hypothetical protein K437DRAFT_273299 [Tilletiaria anomala UBC 951]